MTDGDPYYDQQRRDEAQAKYASRCEQRDRFCPPGEDWLEAKDRKRIEAEKKAKEKDDRTSSRCIEAARTNERTSHERVPH